MVVGILGAGQLAQLLADQARPLDIDTLCFSDSHDVPAAKTSPLFIGKLTNPDDLYAFAKQVDVITLENENIAEDVIDTLSQYVPVYPDKKALYHAQDRLFEKTLFSSLNIDTPRFSPIDSVDDVDTALETVGLPAILKTRRFGYDGKGQFKINTQSDLAAAIKTCPYQPLILEELILFDFEVSILAARNTYGQCVYYPLIRNEHQNGILRTSTSPINLPELQTQAEETIQKLLQHLDYTGLLALELFVKDGKLMANEMAPRVHNSGHLTLEGCNTNQFRSHLQAITGRTLTEPNTQHFAIMINIIGQYPHHLSSINEPGVSVYHYGKTPRKDRKLGHVTITAKDKHDMVLKIKDLKLTELYARVLAI